MDKSDNWWLSKEFPWLDRHMERGAYHVVDLPYDPIPFLHGYGDSLHHTLFFAALAPYSEMVEEYVRLESFFHLRTNDRLVRCNFFLEDDLQKKWQYNNWWRNPNNLSRDQFQMAVIFCSLYRNKFYWFQPKDSYEELKRRVHKTILRIVKRFGMYENILKNTTNEKKVFPQDMPDILSPTALNQWFYFYEINGRKYFKIFRKLTDIFILFEALYKKYDNATDDCKFLANLVVRYLNEDMGFIEKFALKYYFKHRKNSTGIKEDLPVSNPHKIFMWYFREPSGEAPEMYSDIVKPWLEFFENYYLVEEC